MPNRIDIVDQAAGLRRWAIAPGLRIIPFLDNGGAYQEELIAMLKSALERQGHCVKVIDGEKLDHDQRSGNLPLLQGLEFFDICIVTGSLPTLRALTKPALQEVWMVTAMSAQARMATYARLKTVVAKSALRNIRMIYCGVSDVVQCEQAHLSLTNTVTAFTKAKIHFGGAVAQETQQQMQCAEQIASAMLDCHLTALAA